MRPRTRAKEARNRQRIKNILSGLSEDQIFKNSELKKAFKSKGEIKVAWILTQAGIEWEYEPSIYNGYTVQWIDFYLPSFEVAIEYDGTQHSKSGLYGSVDDNKSRDDKKERWAEENGIKLVRLSGKPERLTKDDVYNAIR